MKKALSLLLALIMCLSIAACSTQNSKSNTPLADKLKQNAEESPSLFQCSWLVYKWTVNGLDSFKDPASVELTGNAYYSDSKRDNGEPKFFLVEFRANNGFGGKTVSYAKVTETGITSIDWEPHIGNFVFEGEKVYNAMSISDAQEALQEYIDNNYR